MSRISASRAVRLVAKREITTRLRTRSFVVSTAVLLLLLIGYVALEAFLAGSAATSKVALTGQAQGIAQQLHLAEKAEGRTIEVVTVPTEQDGLAEVRSGAVDALVSGSASRLRVAVKSTVDPQLQRALDGIVQQQVLDAKLSAADLDPVSVHQAVSAAHVEVQPLGSRDPHAGQKLVVGLVVAVLLYLSIITYGTLVAQGVVEEKASRVVEILLSTVRPWHLLLGKVLGLGIVGLAQLAILAVAGLVAAFATGVLGSIAGIAVSAVVWGAVWYLLGFLLYAMIYGAAGSLVSRQEDTQSVVAPVNIALVIGFVAGLNLITQSADSAVTKVVSLIPLLSPILMPARIATGSASPWEIVTSVVLTTASIALVTWLGARIYRNGVLRVGSRVKLSEALRG
ncbi:ABC transporter permease [Amycolatopsis sp. FDAARGOS 1241]|uniref:ABC transporter permease n=1 Tax=Amycolatopsis sp. FDAARGOS 1241 TaxID=2778070 RepID=UPI00194F6B5E|nr:ABC transporter permease [Amycolatopsis sp. FDAARGOS 1241]QRP46817.1 ABC transporter permease [Amycolatopsis sp. FDAARGOS 1241]